MLILKVLQHPLTFQKLHTFLKVILQQKHVIEKVHLDDLDLYVVTFATSV